MREKVSISLVRHGQVHNPQKIFYGRLPRFRLSGEGVHEARSAGAALNGRKVSALYSSPLLRARQTARAIQSFRPDLNIRLSRLLLEVHSPWDGKPSAVVDQRRGDIYTGSGPGFEKPPDIAMRVRRFFKRVLKTYRGGHVAAVTHGDVVAFAVLWACRAALSARHKAGLHQYGITDGYPATGSITTFLYDSDSVDDLPDITYTRPGRQ